MPIGYRNGVLRIARILINPDAPSLDLPHARNTNLRVPDGHRRRPPSSTPTNLRVTADKQTLTAAIAPPRAKTTSSPDENRSVGTRGRSLPVLPPPGHRPGNAVLNPTTAQSQGRSPPPGGNRPPPRPRASASAREGATARCRSSRPDLRSPIRRPPPKPPPGSGSRARIDPTSPIRPLPGQGMHLLPPADRRPRGRVHPVGRRRAASRTPLPSQPLPPSGNRHDRSRARRQLETAVSPSLPANGRSTRAQTSRRPRAAIQRPIPGAASRASEGLRHQPPNRH